MNNGNNNDNSGHRFGQGLHLGAALQNVLRNINHVFTGPSTHPAPPTTDTTGTGSQPEPEPAPQRGRHSTIDSVDSTLSDHNMTSPNDNGDHLPVPSSLSLPPSSSSFSDPSLPTLATPVASTSPSQLSLSQPPHPAQGDDQRSMPSLDSASDSDAEVERDVVMDDHDSAWTDESLELPLLPPLPARTGSRRARVEDDVDEARDRRHPSERLNVPPSLVPPPLPASSGAQSQPQYQPQTARAGGAQQGAGAGPPPPMWFGGPGEQGRSFMDHFGAFLSGAGRTPQPQGGQGLGQTQAQGPGQQPRGGPIVSGFTITIPPNGPPTYGPLPNEQHLHHNPTPAPGAGTNSNEADHTPAPPRSGTEEGAAPNLSSNPNLNANSNANSDEARARLGDLGDDLRRRVLHSFLDFIVQIPGMTMMPMSDEQREDPERARKLVDALETVPHGLVRRLECVGAAGAGNGDLGDAGVGAGAGTGAGEAMCAICWDGLLDAESDGFKAQQPEATDAAADSDASTSTSTAPQLDADVHMPAAASPAEDAEPLKEKGEAQPRIVCLPCAHVFHESCMLPWFTRAKQATCPTCRFNIDPDNLTRSHPAMPSFAWPPPAPRAQAQTQTQTGEAGGTPQAPQAGNQGDANVQQAEGQQQQQPPPLPPHFLPLGQHIILGSFPLPPRGQPQPPSGNAPAAAGVAGGAGAGAGGAPSESGADQQQLGQEQQQRQRPTADFMTIDLVFNAVLPWGVPGGAQGQGQSQPGQGGQTGEGAGTAAGGDNANSNANDAADRGMGLGFQDLHDLLTHYSRRHGAAQGPGPDARPPSQPQPTARTQAQTSAQPQPQPAQAQQAGRGGLPQWNAVPLPFGPRDGRPTRPMPVRSASGGFTAPVAPSAGAAGAAGISADAATGGAGPEDGFGFRFVPFGGFGFAGPGGPGGPAPTPAPGGPGGTVPGLGLGQSQREGGRPQQRPAPPPRRVWALPPAPGPSLRQRVEQKEREAGLRCFDVSCGVGPSDEEPLPSASLSPSSGEGGRRRMKQTGIRPHDHDHPHRHDGQEGEDDQGHKHAAGKGEGVCAHTFHPACLVSAERVAGWGGEDKDKTGAQVEVACPVCRAIGWVSREDWEEGVHAL